MAEILYIRLGSQAQDEISWLIFNTLEQEIIASGALANAEQLSALTEKAQTRVVKVFVPGCDVLLKQLTVPTKSSKAMRSAVPYMLEDELAQDVDDLFFAYATINSDTSEHNCFVAITERAQMLLWQSWLADAAIATKSMQPDILAMPYTEGQWSAIALHPERVRAPAEIAHAKTSNKQSTEQIATQPTQVIVRQGEWQGYTLDSDAWQFTLQSMVTAAQATQRNEKTKDKAKEKKQTQASTKKSAETQENNSQHADEEALRTDLIINAYSALPLPRSLLEESNTTPPSAITLVNAEEELPLALFAQQQKPNAFNLLQGEFTIKERRSPHLNNWLWAAGFAVCALVLNVGYKSAQLYQLSAQQAQVEAQIIARYQQAFPQATRVRIGTIKSQLNQALSQQGSGGEQVGFLSMLAQVQPAFAKVPNLTPESLKFDGKRQELRVQAIADDYQHFEQFKNALNLVNVEVKQGAQNNQGEQVTGSFSIVSKDGI